jgi:hypothetical protein
MSFIVRVIIGHFDAADAMANRRPPRPVRHLTAEDVERVQAACDQLFAMERRLAESHTGGLLWMEGLHVSPAMYQAACAAHELLGAVAVDVAHGAMVYPADEPLPPRGEVLARWRENTGLPDDEVERRVDDFLAAMAKEADARRAIRDAVRAYAAASGVPSTAG